MLTGIYVYQATTLSFSASETIELQKFGGAKNEQLGTPAVIPVNRDPMPLSQGVYKIISNDVVGITGTGVGTAVEVVRGVVRSPGEKTTWPDPSLAAQKLGVDAQQVAEFFADAKAVRGI
jgi:hypothetical protein